MIVNEILSFFKISSFISIVDKFTYFVMGLLIGLLEANRVNEWVVTEN